MKYYTTLKESKKQDSGNGHYSWIEIRRAAGAGQREQSL